jgi:hypothetical protein
VKRLHEQLREAWKASGLTLVQILDLSRLEISESQLSRKLAGHSPVTTAECESIARVLGLRVEYGRDRRRAA